MTPRFSSTTSSRVTWRASFESVLEAGPHRVTFDRERFPDAPENVYAHLGAGVNMVYVDPVHNLVVVARWIEGDAVAEFVRLVLAAIDDE